MEPDQLPLAMTCGCPSGIGPELALKAWLARDQLTRPFMLLADPQFMSALAEKLGLPARVESCLPQSAAGIFGRALPVLALANPMTGPAGRPVPADAPATLESIRSSVQLVHSSLASAVVTNPISKAALYSTGFEHPGHTEFLGELSQQIFGQAATPVMMIWSPELAVVPVTIHMPLARVPRVLTTEMIVEAAEITARDLASRFGIARPRLAVTGLNPHAGEDGSMGREDIEIVAPAIAELRRRGVAATGPHPADTLFHAAARKNYDAVIGMYHDQVLIPVKTLAFDTGVNVTLGLPFIRTSPDHGTAFDIAGQGVASCSSLLAALNLAARLT